MEEILCVDACVRGEASRTRRLCRAVLDALREGGSRRVTTLELEKERIEPLDADALGAREALLRAGALEDPAFRPARLLRDADLLVVAAPYWDLSFPARLKCFFEAASVNGIVFRYGADGRPVGLCRARRMYYVTTSGGFTGENLGYAYAANLLAMYGVRDSVCVSAQGLDIAGNDAEAILRAAAEKARASIG